MSSTRKHLCRKYSELRVYTNLKYKVCQRGARAPQGSPWFPRLSATVCEVFCTIPLFVSRFLFQIEKKEEIPEESLDWWSKFFASIGDEEKCGEFLNLGYKKMTVLSLASFRQRGIV